MSLTIYYTPQQVRSGHTSRFFRRAAEAPAPAEAPAQPVHSWFASRTLTHGERTLVVAGFASGTAWSASSVVFTLYAAGVPVTGYNAVSASVGGDGSGRLFTASAVIDLTASAAYPLADGDYVGEFLVTTSTGEIVAAQGRVTVCSPGDGDAHEADEYRLEGGVE